MQSDASDRPTTPPERFAGAFGSHAKGDAKESADEDRRPCCRNTNARGDRFQDLMWHLSEANAPAPQRGKPGAAPSRAAPPKSRDREAAWGGPGPDADAGPPTCVSDDESDRRSKSPACIERAQHDAVPQTPPPPPPPMRAGSPASRVAASYKRLAALRVNDDDPPPPRQRTRSLDDEYDPRRAVPKYRVSERRRENTLRDSLLPERPAPNADDGFMLGLMTAIGCGTISCGCGEEDIS